VTTNPFMHDMMRRAGVSSDRLCCVPTFADTEMFSPPAAGGARDYLLCLGRLDAPKGVDVLIDALALVRARLGARTPRLKIVGAGHQDGYVRALHAQVASRQLADLIDFHGEARPEDTPALFRGALCSIIPALWFENLPNALIESLSCGTPVIASNIGSLAASITDGEEGLLAAPGDPADLAAKIERFLGDTGLRERLSSNARAAALGRFSATTHMARLTDLFETLARPRAALALAHEDAVLA
jgi:glycosyltransferase involved in cell wall biosynthesis